ncbi:hypothetical protein MY3296_008417 [Beauveria thailandica]
MSAAEGIWKPRSSPKQLCWLPENFAAHTSRIALNLTSKGWTRRQQSGTSYYLALNDSRRAQNGIEEMAVILPITVLFHVAIIIGKIGSLQPDSI